MSKEVIRGDVVIQGGYSVKSGRFDQLVRRPEDEFLEQEKKMKQRFLKKLGASTVGYVDVPTPRQICTMLNATKIVDAGSETYFDRLKALAALTCDKLTLKVAYHYQWQVLTEMLERSFQPSDSDGRSWNEPMIGEVDDTLFGVACNVLGTDGSDGSSGYYNRRLAVLELSRRMVDMTGQNVRRRG